MATLGIDIGSTTSKAVILSDDGERLHALIRPTGANAKERAAELIEELHACEPVTRIVATGYGRSMVEGADRVVTEITCHAKGVHSLHPDARSLIDIGGQDSKVIRLNDGGGVEDFAMNDRCAAGTGSFLDKIAHKFDRSVETFSDLHAANPIALEISSTCVVFAESEVIGLVARGHAIEDVLFGVHLAIAKRVATMAKQVGITPPLYFAGGVAQNETMRRALEAELHMPILRADSPQLTGAIGAARL